MRRKWIIIAGMLVVLGFAGHAQAPPSGPSEKELQQPFTLADEKPTPSAAAPSEPSGWRAIGSTVLVLGVVGAGLWAFRKYGVKKLPGQGGGRLKMEETLALGDRRFVSILKADDEQFLLALSPQGITLLARLDGVETAPQGPFTEVLERQVEVTRPTPVRELEAMMKGEQP